MKKLTLIFLNTFSLIVLSTPVFAGGIYGEWTRDKGDCKSFVYGFEPNNAYRTTTKYLVYKKRKDFSGEHQITQQGNIVEHIWIQKASGITRNSVWEHKIILKMISKDVMKEIYHITKKYHGENLYHVEWNKQDGSHSNKLFDSQTGKWNNWKGRRGLFTFYRCE